MTANPNNEGKLREYLKRVTLELQKVRAELDTRASADQEPIAIVGMACRLPGGIESPADFWQLLSSGGSAIGEFPTDRGWDLAALFAEGERGTCSVRRGGFLRDPAGFDAAFFGVSPREAIATDPQQRLMLEVAWEALESAGIDPLSLQASPTGVYVGLWHAGYAAGAARTHEDLEGFMSVGAAPSIASGRIAYVFGLHGPTLSIDTACSSSLVGLHLACQALKQRECSLALAGGVTVMATPDTFIEFSRQGNLARDGHCKPFSARADGTAWSEGAALLVLERASDAERNGHRVYGLVRGSAINQDGKSQGLTAPNGPAQQAVISQALAAAQLTAADVDVVEAHGTGTTLGDPIEAHAILASYGREHSSTAPLILGSVKSNLGHTQAAAGVAGVIKLLLAFEHERIPRSLFGEDPTPHVDWSAGHVQLAAEPLAWPRRGEGGRRRRAAVSSFGFSGTNAHVILEEPPPLAAPSGGPEQPGALPFVLSAKSAAALSAYAGRLEAWLARTDASLSDLAYSLATTRSRLTERAVLVASTRAELAQELSQLAAAAPQRVRRARGKPVLAYLFTGQGSQRAQMGLCLYERWPAFREALDAVFEAFAGQLPQPLRAVMFAPAGTAEAALLDRTVFTQCALFALETALFRLLSAWGIRPDYLLGHSLGEIVAAHCGGVLSLADACRLVAARGRLMQDVAQVGKMAAVQAPAAEVEALLAEYPGASLAAINAPRSVVISGDAAAVDAARGALAARGREVRALAVSHAFHSHHMQPMLQPLRELVAGLSLSASAIPIVSNVSGAVAAPELHASPDYWVEQARAAVQFHAGVRTLAALPVDCYLELGPRGLLSGLVEDALADDDAPEPRAHALLRGDQPEVESLLRGLGAYHAAGGAVDWQHCFEPGSARAVALPTYAFQRERYWLPADAQRDAAMIGMCSFEHPLLAASTTLAEGDAVIFTGRLSLGNPSWLADHALNGSALLPGAAFAELACAAAGQIGLDGIEDLALEAPLWLAPSEPQQLQIVLGALDERGQRTIAISSRAEAEGLFGAWRCHARGVLGSVAPLTEDLCAWPPAAASRLPLDGVYERLSALGLHYGPALRGLTAVYRGDGALFVEVELPAAVRHEAERYVLHPALLDAALHALALEAGEAAHVPFAWQGLRVTRSGVQRLRVRIARDGDSLRLLLADELGTAIGAVTSLRMRPAPQRAQREELYAVQWRPAALAESDAQCVWFGEPGVANWSELAAAGGAQLPERVLLDVAVLAARAGDCTARAAEEIAHAVLQFVQRWLEEPRLLAHRLVLVTRCALQVGAFESVDLRQSPVWGLVRVAQTEHPDCGLAIVDIDAAEASRAALARAIRTDRPQLALRDGELYEPLLARKQDAADMALPGVPAWSLQVVEPGTLDGLALQTCAPRELGPHDVQVSVHATGINFRDVLAALGMYPGDPGPLGYEGSGVVAAVGCEVRRFAPGDRVMGLFLGGFSPSVVEDQRRLVKIPAGLEFERAAGVPLVFLTAYYALRDLAGAQAGQKLLVHAAAGGVGMAALQLARHFGLEVFATASPRKWGVLRELGIPADHLASSRDLGFEAQFRACGGALDIVLDSLAGEFVDASLRLLAPGGRFIEMGKTDVRDPARVAADHGVHYRAFDLSEAGVDRLAGMLDELCRLFEDGSLRPLPTRSWDVRDARPAFRHMAQAEHIGKLVLRMPALARAGLTQGSVLVTGGSGAIAAQLARHLVHAHGVRHLILCSRSGGGAELRDELQAAGARVRLARCDVAQRAEVAQLLAGIDRAFPLCAVIHAAGVTSDAVLTAQDEARLREVFAAKVHGAWHLHELTRGQDLAAFVLLSSVSGVLGGAGQANYAAANTFLDALAAQRKAEALPASSLAYGLWDDAAGLGAKLSHADRERIARAGLRPLAAAEALRLFDAALARPEPQLVAVGLSPRLRAAELSLPLSAAKPGAPAQRDTAPVSSLAGRIAALPATERARVALEHVRAAVATVMRISSAALQAELPLKDLGLDSLMAVELRNQLARAVGLRLPSTLLFDYPTPQALAGYLLSKLAPTSAPLRAAPAQVAAAQSGGAEPIAVVAMSCRFGGGIDTPERLWQLLCEERDAMSEVPAERGWDVASLFDADPERRGTATVLRAAFLQSATEFDAGFFGISPREALAMDPQQRLLLEAAWETFERAGVDPAALRGTPTGVYLGLWPNGYGGAQAAAELEGLMAIGTAGSVASGRIAYCLGLEGPAVTVDTACSSSLVALHLAVQALRQGDCAFALAGGATIMALPSTFVEFSRQGNLAPDGRCKAFSADADGTAWGEGVALIALERLSDAQRHGHRVLALIRGSAVNQDGRSQGLTAPNGPAQERVIAQALASAGLRPTDIDAVEAHGTGTVLGDPIEAQALIAAYGQDRAAERPLWLGSLKSNLGHTQAAAGIGGLIKLVLSLEHGVLPKTLYAALPTPHVDWSAGQVRLLNEAVPWPAGTRTRRAAVSSFGMSGTNSHVIVEEAPRLAQPSEARSALEGPLPFVLSAKSEGALAQQAARLRSHLADHPELALEDVAYSLAADRARFPQRAVLVAADRAQLLQSLADVAAGTPPQGAAMGRADLDGKIVFVFPGQGSQWQGMARSLLATSRVFAEELSRCEAALAPHVSWSLRAILEGDDYAFLDRLDMLQPALFSINVALAALWRAHGVEPDAVVGHSQGEVAAAYVAGALSLEDAARIMAVRSKALQTLSGRGAMAVIELSVTELEPHLAPHADRIAIAAINGTSSTIVSGEPAAMNELLEGLAQTEIVARRMRVEVAGHCAHVDTIRDSLLAELADVTPLQTCIPLYSTVSSGPIDGRELDALYWFRNARETVRFSDATDRLIADGYRFFVEVSAHQVLRQSLEQASEVARTPLAALRTIRREDGGLDRVLVSLGELHVRGYPVDYARLLAERGGRSTPLPTYAFARERFWLRPELAASDASALGLTALEHPLLTASSVFADGSGALFSARFTRATHPWLYERRRNERAVLSEAALLEIALTAAQALGLDHVHELSIEAPLVLPERGALCLQIRAGALEETGRRSLTLFARTEGEGWQRCAAGLLGKSEGEVGSELRSFPPSGAEAWDPEPLYEALAAKGLVLGEAQRLVRSAHVLGNDWYVQLELPEAAWSEAGRCQLHPLLCDAIFHAAQSELDAGVVPLRWQGVTLHRAGATSLRVRLQFDDARQSATLLLADGFGAPLGAAERIELAKRELAAEQTASTALDALYSLAFQPASEMAAKPYATLGAWDPRYGAAALEHWSSLEALQAALDAGATAPETLVCAWHDSGAERLPEACVRETTRALELLQRWLSDERLGDTQLVFLTRGAIGSGAGGASDLCHAPLWGLMRSAQSEHPDALLKIVDLDPEDPAGGPWQLALGGDEPQLAVRSGGLLAPRVVKREPTVAAELELPEHGTVLISGGTGTLAAVVARGLVTRHGARHLVLCSRTGRADALVSELEALGAEVRVASCDVADRGQLEQLLASIPAAHPLVAVVHAAGALSDGALAQQTAASVQRVFEPKVWGAWHLHELTRELPLRAFVLFSSFAGVTGARGQSNYAAANSFLDALAHQRRALGLPGLSLDWGYWAEKGALAAHLTDADVARMARGGVLPLATEDGLALFDAALASGETQLVPVRLSPRLLREPLEALPSVLRALSTRRRRASGAASFKLRWAELRGSDREAALMDVIKAEVAAVLGLRIASIEPARPLTELGMDSLMALELRNRLTVLTGLRMPGTVVFDHNTPAALATYILPRLQADVRSESRDAPVMIGTPLLSMVSRAAEAGEMAVAWQMIDFAVRQRRAPDFSEGVVKARVHRVATGGSAPHFVCIPSPVPPHGPTQFLRLAHAVQGKHALSVISLPGYAAGEPLLGSLNDAVNSLAAAAIDAAGGEPFVVLGYSSGGYLAYEVGFALERSGCTPRGIVLLDTPIQHRDILTIDPASGIPAWRAFFHFELPNANAPGRRVLADGTILGGPPGETTTEEELTAMARYQGALMGRFVEGDWKPYHGRTRTLLLSCAQDWNIPGTAIDVPPAARWHESHEIVKLPGDHYTFLTEYAPLTAAAISAWANGEDDVSRERQRRSA